MCRSIKILRQPEISATTEEVQAAALQFVRKISGTRKPSRADQNAFNLAVEEIRQASERLLQMMTPRRLAPGGSRKHELSNSEPGEVAPN